MKQKKMTTIELAQEILDETPKISTIEGAKLVGVTPNYFSHLRSVLGKALRAQMVSKRAANRRVKRYLNGHPDVSMKQVAIELNLSPSTLGRVRKRLGLPPIRGREIREGYLKKIVALLEKNPTMSNNDVAKEIGRSRSFVASARKELGMDSLAKNNDILFLSIGQQVREVVLKEGHMMTDSQLAERIGVHPTTAHKWLKRLGLPTGKQRRYGGDEKYFKKMWADGWSDTDISKVMNCSRSRVQKWRIKHDLMANIIHSGIRESLEAKEHTPATLLDTIPSPMGTRRMDKVWAFAALGATRLWLKKRFPDVSNKELDEVCAKLLDWRIPKQLVHVVRRRHIEDPRSGS